MPPASSTNPARQLVHAFADISATEDLVFYVAGADNMLGFCRELLEQYDQNARSSQVQEVKAQCTVLGVLPGALFSEVRKVLLALNRFHDAARNHYTVLGLAENATQDEVKQAYRSLSKQHHPDRQSDPERGAQRFMEIAGAYHAIMDASLNHKTETPAAWRSNHQSPSSDRYRDQKKLFLGLFIIICILIGASVFLAGRYRKNVITSQMHLYGEQTGLTVSTPEEILRKMADKEPVSEREIKEQESGSMIPLDQPAEDNKPVATVIAAPQPRQAMQDTNPAVAQTPLPGLVRVDELPVRGKNSVPSAQPTSEGAAAEKTVSTSPLPRRQDTKQQEQRDRAKRIDTINMSLEISSLVNKYSRLYNHRDLDPFLTLFAEHATENGQSMETMTEQYRSLFAHTKAIDLSIANIDWEKKQNMFLARGSFNVSYTYRDNRTREHTGDITFSMVKEQNTLKIRSLEYEFN